MAVLSSSPCTAIQHPNLGRSLLTRLQPGARSDFVEGFLLLEVRRPSQGGLVVCSVEHERPTVMALGLASRQVRASVDDLPLPKPPPPQPQVAQEPLALLLRHVALAVFEHGILHVVGEIAHELLHNAPLDLAASPALSERSEFGVIAWHLRITGRCCVRPGQQRHDEDHAEQRHRRPPLHCFIGPPHGGRGGSAGNHRKARSWADDAKPGLAAPIAAGT
mmetsp:Transcript_12822/g.26799  ORF Transcript_12822/g.26799 Transcript_12822/m.26799 type:complete len:220 (-) Transcript_12822:3-662(-)